jgi:hypothetical protein
MPGLFRKLLFVNVIDHPDRVVAASKEERRIWT